MGWPRSTTSVVGPSVAWHGAVDCVARSLIARLLTCIQPLPSTRTSTRGHSRSGGGGGSGDNSPPVIGSSCRTPTRKARDIRAYSSRYPCSISPAHKPIINPKLHRLERQTRSKPSHPTQSKSQLPPPPLGQIPHHLLTLPLLIPFPQHQLLLRRHKLPSLQTPPDKKPIPHPAQHIPLCAITPQHNPPAGKPLQRAPHVGQRVRPCRVRLDAGVRQRAVRVERAEERGCPRQVVDGFDSGSVSGWVVATRGEGVDTGGVFGVLGLPEGGVGSAGGVRTDVLHAWCA